MASNIELFGKLANMVDEENKATISVIETMSADQGEQTDAEKAGASAEPDETPAPQTTAPTTPAPQATAPTTPAPTTEPTAPETNKTTTTTNE